MINRKITLTECELPELIRLSEGRVVAFSFGPSGVWLNPEKSPWAVPLLREWRGITVNDGAGI